MGRKTKKRSHLEFWEEPHWVKEQNLTYDVPKKIEKPVNPNYGFITVDYANLVAKLVQHWGPYTLTAHIEQYADWGGFWDSGPVGEDFIEHEIPFTFPLEYANFGTKLTLSEVQENVKKLKVTYSP